MEKEELAIAGEIDSAKDLQDLGLLLREGRMKEFYDVANKMMRIKRSNPVATKIKRETTPGETEIFEEKHLVEQVIAEYFANIYKRPGHMAGEGNDAEMTEEIIYTGTMFNPGDVLEAAKCTNFNKGLGPDGFDGNLLKGYVHLNDKITGEIT